MFLLLLQVTSAQKTELRISTGYNISSGSQYFLSDIQGSNGTFSYEKVDASLGRGVNLLVGIDHSWKSWLGLSVNINYLKTLPAVKGKTEFASLSDYYYSEDNKWRSMVAEISPALLLKVPGKKINPYSSLGFTVPFYSKIKVTANYSSYGLGIPLSKGEKTKIYKLKNTIGYNATMGIAPEINKKVSFFLEARLVSQSIQVKKSSLTSDIANGNERINTYTVSQKETVYVKKLGSQSYNSNEPVKQLGFSLPYSSIGLNLGLSIKL